MKHITAVPAPLQDVSNPQSLDGMIARAVDSHMRNLDWMIERMVGKIIRDAVRQRVRVEVDYQLRQLGSE